MTDPAPSARYAIRVYGVGTGLDQALYLWRDHFRVLFLGVAIAAAPLGLLLDWIESLAIPPLAEGLSGAVPYEFTFTAASVLFSSWFSAAIVATLFEGVFAYYLAIRYQGKPASVKEAVRRAFRLWYRLIPIHFLFYPIFYLLSMFCMVPGMVFYGLFFLRIPVMVLEDIGPLRALGRSVALLRGQWLVAAAFMIAIVTAHFAVDMLLSLNVIPYVSAAARQVAQGIVNCFEIAATVVLYFSARCRNEHIDLDLLAREVDSPGSAQTTL